MNDFGLYVIITDPRHPVEKITELCVKHRIKMLQIREKDLSDTEILSISKRITSITKGSPTKFIINDRTDIAIAAEADGVHLGQDDMPIEKVRELFPQRNELTIGLSTHSIEQVKEALTKKPDYIGFGPIYQTFAKKKPDPVVGCEKLKEVVAMSNIPVVAIGGINRDNVEEVINAGAKNICMIRTIMQAKDLESEIKYFSKLMR